MLINQLLKKTFSSPIIKAFDWLENTKSPPDLELFNMSQAAPMNLPPIEIRDAIAHAAINEMSAHFYGPVLGNTNLRYELSKVWERLYDCNLTFENIAITSGCNHAFCAAITSIAAPGDNVIMPCPWYFNHKMWLDMAGIKTKELAVGADMLPATENIKKLIDRNTKAIVLISPNNPTGVEYPRKLLREFYLIAQKNNLMLILDETYRDFHSEEDPIHDLFKEKDWDKTFIGLYSFSKSFRLTGHRIGALFTDPARLLEIEKFLDSTTICPSQIGQIAALTGIRMPSAWLRNERLEILQKKVLIQNGFKELKNWHLKGCGAYFAYAEHSYNSPSEIICKRLLETKAMLILPGEMFLPDRDNNMERNVRIAFANIKLEEIEEMFLRLKTFEPA